MGFTCRTSANISHVHILAAGRGTEKSSTDSIPGVLTPVTRPLPYRGLLFDTGDVLFDQTAWWRWVVRLLWRLGTPVGYSDLCHTWKTEFRSDVNCGGREYWDAFRALLRSVGLTAGQIEELVLAGRSKLRQSLETLRPLPGVRFTLTRLAAMDMPMGVLSNAASSRDDVIDRLNRLGISSCFQAVLSSYDLGERPSDRRGYCAAAGAMGMATSDIAFVGHDADELAGAANAGMLTIAYNYDADARADVYLDRFGQLIQTVSSRPTRRQAG